MMTSYHKAKAVRKMPKEEDGAIKRKIKIMQNLPLEEVAVAALEDKVVVASGTTQRTE